MSAYEWLIGTRYLRSTHRRGFVSFVALMSVCGLMLGVATLIVVLSVMNGFERELRTRILERHLARHPHGARRHARRLARLQQQVRRAARRAGGGAVHREPGDARPRPARSPGRSVRGVLPEEERARHRPGAAHDRRPPRGSHAPAATASFSAARSRTSSNARVGDAVVLIAPAGHGDARPAWCRACAASGSSACFSSGMYEFDRGLALVHLADAARLFRTRRRGHRPAPGARRSAARAARWCARWRSRSAAGLLRQRLDRRIMPTSSAPSRSPSR